MIGNYRRPQAKPSKSTAAASAPEKPAENSTSQLVEGVTTEFKHELSEGKKSASKVKSYKEILKDSNISDTEAQSIVDDMLTKGYYEKIINVTKTTTATFRSRSQSDYKRYLRALDAFSPKFSDDVTEIQQRYYLTASIVTFKGLKFQHVDNPKLEDEVEEAFNKRLAWVEALPEQLFLLLVGKLAYFDNTIAIVMSEGVVENF